MNLTTGERFNDGAHILYVNGEYRGEDAIGRLMYDFGCTDPDDMNYSLMAEKTRYLKENPEGVRYMCQIMEDLRVSTAKETKELTKLEDILFAITKLNVTPEQAVDIFEVPEQDKENYLLKLKQKLF